MCIFLFEPTEFTAYNAIVKETEDFIGTNEYFQKHFSGEVLSLPISVKAPGRKEVRVGVLQISINLNHIRISKRNSMVKSQLMISV